MKNLLRIVLATLLSVLVFTVAAAAVEMDGDLERRNPGYEEGMRGPDRERGLEGGEDMRGERRGKEEKGGPGGSASLPPGQWWRMPESASLNMSGKEKERLDNLYRQQRRDMIDLKGDVEKEKLDFEYLLEKKDFDESAVKKRFSTLHKLRGNMSEARFNFVIEVRKLLGYERFQQLKGLFKARKRPGKGPRGDQYNRK